MGQFRWIGMSEDGDEVRLRRYQGVFTPPEFATACWFEENPDSWRVGAVVDVETTGMDSQTDRIIEIGVRLFRFHRETGQVLSKEQGYGGLEDPGRPLPAEIVRITGITDEMLAGQKIDWPRVGKLFETAHVILAHNASFDRPFIDRQVPVSSTKIWACTFRQIDWREKGFPSQKLEILSIYHGFFCTAHRALEDADTVLHLIAMADPHGGAPYLLELLRNARRRPVLLLALQSPIETKEALKRRGYRWNAERKVWHRFLYTDECEQEVAWLAENVYGGESRAHLRELALCDQFKHPAFYFQSLS